MTRSDLRSPAQPAGSPPGIDLAGRTTTPAAGVSRAGPFGHAADDLVPLMTRRHWIEFAWGAFTAASAVALASSGRMMFPNVLDEPSQHFKAGFPAEYGIGVDERWKDKFGVWLVRTAEDLVQEDSGFYALIAVCTHLGMHTELPAAASRNSNARAMAAAFALLESTSKARRRGRSNEPPSRWPMTVNRCRQEPSLPIRTGTVVGPRLVSEGVIYQATS